MARFHGREWTETAQPRFIDNDDFARFDVPQVLGPDEIESLQGNEINAKADQALQASQDANANAAKAAEARTAAAEERATKTEATFGKSMRK